MRAPKRRKLHSGELANGEKYYFYRKPASTGDGGGGKKKTKLGRKAKKTAKSRPSKRALGSGKDAEG